jgi:hypothetical protein
MFKRSFIKRNLSFIAWILVGLVFIVAIVSLLQRSEGKVFGISNYLLFPFFGILAFSLMWVHYVMGGVKKLFKLQDIEVKGNYFEITAWIVLFSLLLHPGLLSYQLYVDGAGLPPSSYLENYIAPGMAWAVYLGVVSLGVFLLFELRRKFSDKKWWKYIEYANAVAIWAIYIHAIFLGTVLAYTWLKMVWILYGVVLALSMLILFSRFNIRK